MSCVLQYVDMSSVLQYVRRHMSRVLQYVDIYHVCYNMKT